MRLTKSLSAYGTLINLVGSLFPYFASTILPIHVNPYSVCTASLGGAGATLFDMNILQSLGNIMLVPGTVTKRTLKQPLGNRYLRSMSSEICAPAKDRTKNSRPPPAAEEYPMHCTDVFDYWRDQISNIHFNDWMLVLRGSHCRLS